MRRREFIKLLTGAAAAWPLAARAQRPQTRRIGVLLLASASDPEFQLRISVLREALSVLGWTEKNTAFELRFAEGKLDRLPALAAELVRADADVIVTQGTDTTLAARAATSTIAIVMASIGDAVGIGLVPSLARPGGNVTGMTLAATEQNTKRLALIKEISPDLTRLGVVWNADNASHRLQLQEMNGAAPVLGLRLLPVPLRDARELDAGFQAALQTGVQAVITMDDQLVTLLRARIVALAMQHKLPLVGEFRTMTAAGGLINYGPDQVDMWRPTAAYIDKIFRGAKPADLPIERPIKFELVINLKTAKALGLEISSTLLARADEVIE